MQINASCKWLTLFAIAVTVVVVATPADGEAPAASHKDSVVYSFQGGQDGAYPLAALIADSSGNLYGTTQEGGGGVCRNSTAPGGCGTVFELTPPTVAGGAWTESVIYRFTGHGDGAHPWGGLIFDQSGSLYGTAQSGGLHKNGTVFELTPPSSPGGAWTQNVLYAFQGRRQRDGSSPQGSLVFDSAGNLFGTTYAGGIACSDSAPDGCGTIFELTPPAVAGGTWTEQVIYKFRSTFAGGPAGTLIFDASGNLFGTAVNDGTGGEGTAYKLTLSGGRWKRMVLHNFGGSQDGGYVWAGLTLEKNGTLYGATTGYGGQVGNGGAVFELKPPTGGSTKWTETLVTVFPGKGGYSQGPWGSLLAGGKGALYGTTSSGGTGSCSAPGSWRGCGFVFRLVRPASASDAWAMTVLHDFAGGTDGAIPFASLIYGSDHKLYGTTSRGGGGPCKGAESNGCGTVYEIAP